MENWYEYGYLFNGYKYKYFFWELLIQFRKVVLIVISTALSTKGKLFINLTLLIIITFSGILTAWIEPFHDTMLNNLESLSLLSAAILVYFGFLLR